MAFGGDEQVAAAIAVGLVSVWVYFSCCAGTRARRLEELFERAEHVEFYATQPDVPERSTPALASEVGLAEELRLAAAQCLQVPANASKLLQAQIVASLSIPEVWEDVCAVLRDAAYAGERVAEYRFPESYAPTFSDTVQTKFVYRDLIIFSIPGDCELIDVHW